MTSKRPLQLIRANQADNADGNETKQYSVGLGDKRLTLSRRLFLISLFGLLLIGLLLVGIYKIGGSPSLVPKKIQKSVDFSIYYPSSLPPGYTLDPESFKLAEAGVVLFTVIDSNKKEIVFSEQQQPVSSEIDKFITNYLPLNSALQLPLGQAKVGAYGSAPNIRTVLSLPIHHGPWLIVTAPSEMSQSDLVRIVESLTK